jgi:hypothetical protein
VKTAVLPDALAKAAVVKEERTGAAVVTVANCCDLTFILPARGRKEGRIGRKESKSNALGDEATDFFHPTLNFEH